MAENRMILWIKGMLSWILRCYDESLIERCFSHICGEIGKKAEDSTILDFFRNRYMNGAWCKESRFVKLLTAPMRRLHNRCEQQSDVLEKRCRESFFYGTFCHAGAFSLSFYGTLLLAFAAGSALGMLFPTGRSALGIGVIVATAIFGGLLFPIRKPFFAVCEESCLCRVARKLFGAVEKPHAAVGLYTAEGSGFFAFCSAAVGFFGGWIGAEKMLCILLGVLLVAVILWRTEWGVFLFVPLSAVLPTMAAVGLVGVTAVSYVLHLRFDCHTVYRRTPFFLWIVGFLAAACYAAVTSVTRMSSLKIFMVYFVFTMAFVLIVNTIRTKKHWTMLLIVFVFSAVLVSCYGVWQNFFLQDTTASWVDAEMFEDIKTRVYATLDNPNVLGQYLILLIPLGVALLLSVRTARRRIVCLIGNLIMFACLLYTWSRGAWVGVVLGIGFFLVLKDRRWLILCLAGLLLMPSVLPASILSRLTSIGNVQDSSTAYRVSVWIGSLRLIREYWLTGIGLGSDAFLRIYPHYALGGADFALHSHNFYLQWIVDMGVFGLLVYAGILSTCLTQIARLKSKDRFMKNALLAMSGAMLGYLFQGMAENLWYTYRMILIFWIYMALVQSAVMISEREE